MTTEQPQLSGRGPTGAKPPGVTTVDTSAGTPPVDGTPTGPAPTGPAPAGTVVPEKPAGTTGPEKPAGRPRRPQLPTDRPPGAPPDPWAAFASIPERSPGRLRRGARAAGRALVHEYALVVYAGLLLAVVMTWPAMRYPLHTLPHDLYDPALQAWQMAWSGHILRTDPTQLWHSNAFFPERYTYAYSDSLLGYAPAAMIGTGPIAAVLRYNIVLLLAHALLIIGGYALVRQLGAGRTGAAVAAMAFAYAPWRLAQDDHLNIVSAGGIPLALAMLARGHGWSLRRGFRPERRHAGWAAGGWLVATWQISLGFGIGLPFAYVLAVIAVVVPVAVVGRRLRGRSPRPVLGWRLMVADLLGTMIFAGVGALLAVPYYKVRDLNAGARWTVADLESYSAPLRGLLIAPQESRVWGAAHAVPRESLGWPAEMTLLPGFILLALALAGLIFSVWTVRQRLLLLSGVLVSAVLSTGTEFFGGRYTYLPLFEYLPGWNGLRIPGRLVLWTTLFLSVLAAGAVAELVRRTEQMSAHRMPPWPGPWLRLATLVPLALVTVEGLGTTPTAVVPEQPAALRTVDGSMLVLPTAAVGDQLVMLWSTSRFQPVANGSSTVRPERQDELRRTVATFPDAGSIQYLRGRGITTVVLLRGQVAGTPWERSGEVPVDSLGIKREDLDDAVVFRL